MSMKPPDPTLVARGRRLVHLSVGLPTGLLILSVVLGIVNPPPSSQTDTGNPATDLLFFTPMLILILVSAWKTYRGSRVAPGILALLYAINAFMTLGSCLLAAFDRSFFETNPTQAALGLLFAAILGIVLATFAWILWRSPSVQAFLLERRQKYLPGRRSARRHGSGLAESRVRTPDPIERGSPGQER